MSEVETIYVTEFKNEFDIFQLLHATRNRHKAYIDAGKTGRVIACVPKSAYDSLTAELEAVKVDLIKSNNLVNVINDLHANMTKERDEWKNHFQVKDDLCTSLVTDLAAFESEIKELKQEIADFSFERGLLNELTRND